MTKNVVLNLDNGSKLYCSVEYSEFSMLINNFIEVTVSDDVTVWVNKDYVVQVKET